MAAPDPLSYFDREDEVERETFAELKERFTAEASPRHIRELSNFTFALIKPGCYARGLAPEVLRRLKSAGFRIVDYRLAEFTPEIIDELYEFVRRKYASSWWIMKKVYTTSPTVTLLLKGDPGNYEHLAGRLRAIMGPTTPDAGKPGQIRYDLKGVNRVLNLVHASDDPASAVREALVFFDMGDVLEALVSESDVEIPTESVTPEEKVQISRWGQFNAIKVRAAEHLAGSAKLRELLSREAEVVKANLPIDEERAKLMPIETGLARLARRKVEELGEALVREARSAANVKGKRPTYREVDANLAASRIILALSDERFLAEFREFDWLLMAAIHYGFVEDDWEEIVAHSTWAVMPQMVRDLESRGKPVISSA